MTIVKMSPEQYAKVLKKYGCFSYNNKQAVLYRIAEDMFLVGVLRREIILNRNVLTVDTDVIKMAAKESSKKVA